MEQRQPDHALACLLLRLVWCPWPCISYTLILRAQCLPFGEQEGSYPVGGWGQVSYLTCPAKPSPILCVHRWGVISA